MKQGLLAMCAVVGLCACQSNLQTSSGQSYLDKYKNVPTVAAATTDGVSIEEQIRSVAAVEPVLQFPARIGIAKVGSRRIEPLSSEEAEAWFELAEKLGPAFGEFVPVSPLVAEMVSQSVSANIATPINDVMNKIRLGAARQHLDAVLIYETYAKTENDSNFLSITELTIIGAFILPSRAVEAIGYGNAILIDVVQGYPYATTDVTLEKEEISSTRWNAGDRERELSETVRINAAIKLTKHVEDMMLQLRRDLHKARKE